MVIMLRQIILVFISVSFIFFSCKPQSGQAKIKGKLIHTSCASAVIQVLDEDQYKLGQETWQQSDSKPVYNYVFAVKNQCSFKVNNIKVEDEFYFQLTDKEEKDCAVCMMWDNPPAKKQNIIVVK